MKQNSVISIRNSAYQSTHTHIITITITVHAFLITQHILATCTNHADMVNPIRKSSLLHTHIDTISYIYHDCTQLYH